MKSAYFRGLTATLMALSASTLLASERALTYVSTNLDTAIDASEISGGSYNYVLFTFNDGQMDLTENGTTITASALPSKVLLKRIAIARRYQYSNDVDVSSWSSDLTLTLATNADPDTTLATSNTRTLEDLTVTYNTSSTVATEWNIFTFAAPVEIDPSTLYRATLSTGSQQFMMVTTDATSSTGTTIHTNGSDTYSPLLRLEAVHYPSFSNATVGTDVTVTSFSGGKYAGVQFQADESMMIAYDANGNTLTSKPATFGLHSLAIARRYQSSNSTDIDSWSTSLTLSLMDDSGAYTYATSSTNIIEDLSITYGDSATTVNTEWNVFTFETPITLRSDTAYRAILSTSDQEMLMMRVSTTTEGDNTVIHALSDASTTKDTNYSPILRLQDIGDGVTRYARTLTTSENWTATGSEWDSDKTTSPAAGSDVTLRLEANNLTFSIDADASVDTLSITAGGSTSITGFNLASTGGTLTLDTLTSDVDFSIPASLLAHVTTLSVPEGVTATITGDSSGVSTIFTGAGDVVFTGTVTLSGAPTLTGLFTLASTATLNLASDLLANVTLSGSGLLVAPTSYLPTVGAYADTWTGTLRLTNMTFAGDELGNYGSSSSSIELCGTNSGYLNPAGSAAQNIILTGSLNINNGNSANGGYTFSGKLSGSGAFSITKPDGASTDVICFTGDTSAYTGNITVDTNRCLTFGTRDDDNSTTEQLGCIYIASGYSATIPAGATWTPQNAVVVAGTLSGSGTVDGTLTFQDGATLEVTDTSTSITATTVNCGSTLNITLPSAPTAGSAITLLKSDTLTAPDSFTATANSVACENVTLYTSNNNLLLAVVQIVDGGTDITDTADAEIIAPLAAAEGYANVTVETSGTAQTHGVALFSNVTTFTADTSDTSAAKATIAYDFGISDLRLKTFTPSGTSTTSDFIVLAATIQNSDTDNTADYSADAVITVQAAVEGASQNVIFTEMSSTDIATCGLTEATGTRWFYAPLASFPTGASTSFTVKAALNAVSDAAEVTTGMPSECTRDGTTTAKLFSFSVENAADIDTSTLSITLTGVGLSSDASDYTLTLDGTAVTASSIYVSSSTEEDGDFNLVHKTITLTFTGLSATTGSTATLAALNLGAGEVTLAKSTWAGLSSASSRVATVVANDLVTDGFVESAETWMTNSGEPDTSHLYYRIPAVASNGAGEVIALYDVRYGGGDLGVGNVQYTGYYNIFTGIDIGESYSADGGSTWNKPVLGVDVTNFRNADGSMYNGATSRDSITIWMDIGDPAMLYDPATATYWMMAITGGGLTYTGTSGILNDCVLYTRPANVSGATQWKEWTHGEEQSNTTDGTTTYRSVKTQLLKSLEAQTGNTYIGASTFRGILEGPGHGFVTTQDVTASQVATYSHSTGETTTTTNVTLPAGTLVFPLQAFVNSNASMAQSCAVYSTDGGQTWSSTNLTPRTTASNPDDGSSAVYNAQENCVVELDDGSWQMMCKGGTTGSGNGRRYFFRSTDHTTWSFLPSDTQTVIHVQGSFLKLGKGADGVGRYVLAHQNSTSNRENLSLFFGTDVTATNTTASTSGISWDWNNPIVLHKDNTGGQGYNSLCMIDATTLGVVYETGGQIFFERIDVSDYLK